MKLIIDSDSIYFRIACVAETNQAMKKGIKGIMDDIERQTWSDDFQIAIKGDGNFRKDLVTNYKGNRKPLDDSMLKRLTYGIDYMVDKYNAQKAHGMEADDLVAIWACEAREKMEEYTVVGIDKDLFQIPGNHYNFVKKEHKFVDPDEANYNLMIQCLTGDNADNIPGIYRIGPKKAIKILHGVPMERRWNRVKAAWRKHNAGNPMTSWRLLKMVESWDEFFELEQLIKDKGKLEFIDSPYMGELGDEA